MFLIMGLCQPVIYFIGETVGIKYTNASFSGLMIALIPVVTVLLSAVFLHEKVSARTFGWILCSVVGAFIISAVQTGNGTVQLKGILGLLVAVLSAVVFYLLSRSVSDYFTPFERTFIMLIMGFVCFTVSAAVREGSDFLPLLKAGLTDKYVMLPILYLALLSSVAAFMLQNYAITHLSVAQCTVFENIIPVVSVAAGVIFLGEPFSVIQLVGMALILLGVWKVSTSKDSAPSE
jgi:drug/metabolite transporter (DMT)-like permease